MNRGGMLKKDTKMKIAKNREGRRHDETGKRREKRKRTREMK